MGTIFSEMHHFMRQARGEMTTHGHQTLPQFTNSQVRCAFSGSDDCLPSVPCCSFYLRNYSHFFFHATKP